MGEPEPEFGFPILVPQELEAGVYANALTVWHTAYEFTLDFSVMQRAQRVDEDDPESAVVVPVHVVARVKIPVTLMFDLLRALNASMTVYEAEWGDIRSPEKPEGDT